MPFSNETIAWVFSWKDVTSERRKSISFNNSSSLRDGPEAGTLGDKTTAEAGGGGDLVEDGTEGIASRLCGEGALGSEESQDESTLSLVPNL